MGLVGVVGLFKFDGGSLKFGRGLMELGEVDNFFMVAA